MPLNRLPYYGALEIIVTLLLLMARNNKTGVCVNLIDINMPVVGVHAAQQSSKMALEGQYAPSRLNAFMYQRLVARNAYVVSRCLFFMNT